MKRTTDALKRFATSLVVSLVLIISIGPDRGRVAAQDSEILSAKPPLLKLFDRDKNETTISAPLFNPADIAAMNGFDPSRPPADIRLQAVEYTYPGTTPTPPKTASFVFVPRDKHKSAPSFSVAMDGNVVHQGDATLRELCCVQINGQKQKPQQILVSIPLETLESIDQAKKTEIKLVTERGKYSFKLNNSQKKSIAALAETIK